MDKKTFTVAAAIEIPIAFIILSLLLNGQSDWIFYVAWAAFAVVVSSVLFFLKNVKDETKKTKIRRNFAFALFTFIIIGALIICAVLVAFVIAFSKGF